MDTSIDEETQKERRMTYSLMYLLLQNKDAILALPTWAKYGLLGVLVVSMAGGLINKAWKLVKIVAVCAVLYFAATYFGII